MPSKSEDEKDSVELLMPTFEIHTGNPLFDVHPRSRLWVGLSAIHSIPLKSRFIVLGRIDIYVWINH
jgi:hypothetical protein